VFAALLALGGASSAQFGTVLRETKLASGTGGFTGVLANDYRFGVSVADLGDFDGDGVRDLVVGSHRANIGGAERGAVWLLFLNADGTVREHRQISALSGNLVGPLDDHDRFGISVCPLGDLDLDGTTDIAVGAYRDDDGGTDYGCVYVLFLTPFGTVKREQKISALSGGFTGTLGIEDSFGWSVEAIGDLDDDGVLDLAVGATRDDGADPDPAKDIGALYLLFLRSDGTVKAQAFIGPDASPFGAILRPRDRFGSDVVLLEDADGDGVEDIAVGAFGEDPLKYGRVFVLHLTRAGGVKDWNEIGYNKGGFTGLLGKGDRFGLSLAADDLDGDGIHDLFVGAAGDDDGGAEAGAVWVCLLDALGGVRAFEKISSDFGGFGGLLRPGDNFAISCTTLGDLDRDGAVDLAVGSYQDDQGGFDRGATWILFRAGTGTPVADFVALPGSGEAPLFVAFGDRSSGEITSRTWDFGDGSTSTEVNPLHAFENVGVHDVRLTVRGPRGSDTLLRQRAVVAKPIEPPEADFTFTPGAGPAPLAVAFTDRSTGTITSWSWDFGDGTSASQRYPKHTFEVPGSHTVALTVSGPLGTSTKVAETPILVADAPPEAAFVPSVALEIVPVEVSFTDLSLGLVTAWAWDFGDGTGSSERQPTHTYTSVGYYDVSLSVTGPGGSDTFTLPRAVGAAPPMQAAFDFVSPGGVAPITVRFTDLSTGGPTGWSWDFGDGTSSSLRSPSHTFTRGGTFPVTLTVTRSGLSRSFTLGVPIGEPRPVARFAYSTPSGPAPLRVRFTDQSIGNITSWEWDFGDGASSREPDPVHAYWTPGTYTVRFRVTSAGGTNGVVRSGLVRVSAAPPDAPPQGRAVGSPAAAGTSARPKF
jgi:PKD repeat protein